MKKRSVEHRVIGLFLRRHQLIKEGYKSIIQLGLLEFDNSYTQGAAVRVLSPLLIIALSDTRNIEYLQKVSLEQLLFEYHVDTGRNLNVNKTFRGLAGRLLDVLCVFNLRPVSSE